MKYFVTKYALTQGILEVDGDLSNYSSTNIMETRIDGYNILFHGNEFHHDLEYAKLKSEEIRVKKIASLKKQLAKLEAMEF